LARIKSRWGTSHFRDLASSAFKASRCARNSPLLQRRNALELLTANASPGIPNMKNIHDVLRQKELDIARTRLEIEALRVAARLLADDIATYVPTVTSHTANDAVPAPAVVTANHLLNPASALVRHDFRGPSARELPIGVNDGKAAPLGCERRRIWRCNIVDVHLVPVSAFQSAALLLDLSETGMGVQALVTHPPAGSTSELRFLLPDSDVWIDGVGTVAWTDDAGRLGICFDKIAETCRPQLSQWLSRERKSQMAQGQVGGVFGQNEIPLLRRDLPDSSLSSSAT
jgi:hypothetical protein